MSLWRQQRPAVRPTTVLVTVAVVGAVLLTLLPIGLMRGNDNGSEGPAEQRSGAGPASTSTQGATLGEGSKARGEVRLPAGTHQANGYPVGFPHTDLGAVATLNLATTTNTNGKLRNIYYSGTQLVRWVRTGDGAHDEPDDEAGDWKVVEPSAQDVQQVASLPQLPAVAPSDPHSAESGWIAIKTPTPSTGTATGSDTGAGQ